VKLDAVLNHPFPPTTHHPSVSDCILYALAAGLGANPCDEKELPFVYEGNSLAMLPTMTAVIGMPPFWFDEPDLDMAWESLVHGEEAIEIHRPLTPGKALEARVRIADIADKGADHGALINMERELHETESGQHVATIRSSLLARRDGGFRGGEIQHLPPLTAKAAFTGRDPDVVCDFETLPQNALLYRLCGDMNKLHADPKVAEEAGFPRPILHGLCTFAVAGHALLRHCCGYDPGRLKAFAVRFVAPVYPGETIRTEIWREGEEIAFRCMAAERGVAVIERGSARISPANP